MPSFYNSCIHLQAVDKISELIQTFDRVEPSNPFLHCSVAKGFARVVSSILKLMEMLSLSRLQSRGTAKKRLLIHK